MQVQVLAAIITGAAGVILALVSVATAGVTRARVASVEAAVRRSEVVETKTFEAAEVTLAALGEHMLALQSFSELLKMGVRDEEVIVRTLHGATNSAAKARVLLFRYAPYFTPDELTQVEVALSMIVGDISLKLETVNDVVSRIRDAHLKIAARFRGVALEGRARG